VLAVSLGLSAVRSLLSLIGSLTAPQALSARDTWGGCRDGLRRSALGVQPQFAERLYELR
jgi:hypothetical protein